MNSFWFVRRVYPNGPLFRVPAGAVNGLSFHSTQIGDRAGVFLSTGGDVQPYRRLSISKIHADVISG